jgi:hypothetical protein
MLKKEDVMNNRNLARLIGALCIGLFAFPLLVMAAQGSGEEMEFRYSLEFNPEDFVFRTLKGYDVVELRDGGFTSEVGKPMLPIANLTVALPEGMEATGIKILNVREEEIPGTYKIYPTQPALPTSRGIDESEFVKPDKKAYRSMDSFPSKVIELSEQTDLAGQIMGLVMIYPVHYVPGEEKLTAITSIEFVIEGTDGYVCGDYLPLNISDSGREMYDKMVKGMVRNPEDVVLRVSNDSPRLLGVDPGNYDYVIITQDSWVDDFQPLADWKTKKGIPATIVTTDWVYSEYSGSNNQAKIKAFVQDAHSTWGAIYFLLGGDTNSIPAYTRNIEGDNIPGDTYYGDYDYDWRCEVHVGRAAIRTTSAVGTFIDKILTYEQDPPLSNYAKTASLFGFDLYTNGSDEGEGCKRDIYNLYFPSGWTMRNEYDSESGSHKSDVISYMNQGSNLINHIDHCGEYIIGIGYTNHGQSLGNSDMDNLYNGDYQSIFYSIGCWPAAFDYTACIAEHFVRDTNGGGVAFVGNTRYGWYSPYYDDYYSLRYDRYFFRSLFSQNHYKLGECFSDHKNDGYQSSGTYKYIFYELSLLGDPELPVWTENPENLDTVSYPGTIMIGSQDFTVDVSDGGSPVSGALVCAMKGDEVYATGTTGSGGSVTLSINPMSAGTMDVTVTARNYLPSEGTSEVTGDTPDVTVTLVPDATEVPRGGQLGYDVIVTNNSTTAVSLQYWTDIILWNGNPFDGNPLFGPFSASLDPSETKQGHLTHAVPAGAPLGTYECHGKAGSHPSTIWGQDYFEFTITE